MPLIIIEYETGQFTQECQIKIDSLQRTRYAGQTGELAACVD